MPRIQRLVGRQGWKTDRRFDTNKEGSLETESNSMTSIRSSKDLYFPSSLLLGEAHKLGVNTRDNFPFLTIPQSLLQPSQPKDWKFLERFDVRFEPNLSFYLEILHQHEVRTLRPGRKRFDVTHIMRTYELLSDHCDESNKAELVTYFKSSDHILDPISFASGIKVPRWLKYGECIWEGPENLLDQVPLASIPRFRDNEKITRLFRDYLGTRNADWNDYKEAILELKGNYPDNDVDVNGKVRELYKAAEGNLLNEDWEMIRSDFESENLIYVRYGCFRKWFSPSECLWTSVPHYPQQSLRLNYANEYHAFFVKHLNLATVPLAAAVEGLCAFAGRKTILETAPRTRQMIWEINAMNPTAADLAPLKKCNILPVRKTNGVGISFKRTKRTFAINNREKLAKLFVNHVRLLDFDFDEVCRLDPFLRGLGLEKRFLSRLCNTDTFSDGDGDIENELTRKFRARAYWILRCAAFYPNPLPGTIIQPLQLKYHFLTTALILVTDNITTSYTLRFKNGKEIGPIHDATGYVAIRPPSKELALQIFVPRDDKKREICYTRHLSAALIASLDIDPAAREIISDVLNSSLSVIDEILEDAGIGQVPGIEPPPFNLNEKDVQEPENFQPVAEEPNEPATAKVLETPEVPEVAAVPEDPVEPAVPVETTAKCTCRTQRKKNKKNKRCRSCSERQILDQTMPASDCSSPARSAFEITPPGTTDGESTIALTPSTLESRSPTRYERDGLIIPWIELC